MATSPRPGGGTLDFGGAFQFFFQDPEWGKKILMGGLFSFLTMLLVGIPFVLGYTMRVLQRSYAGDPRPLPEWDDYGALFSEGLRAVGLYLAHVLGVLLLPGSIGCALAAMGSAMTRSGSEAAGGLLALAVTLLWILIGFLMLLLMIYLPAAFTRMTLYQRLGAGFELRENFDLIRRNPANYAIALLIYLVANFVAQFGIILCCVGVFPASFWSMCVMGYVLGEVARRDAVIGQPAPAAPVA